jgi:hypothetical protein
MAGESAPSPAANWTCGLQRCCLVCILELLGVSYSSSAERGSLAGSAGEIPASFNVLATTARLGGTGHLVEHLAVASERVPGELILWEVLNAM